MSTDLMKTKNSTGSLTVTGVILKGKRTYQITVACDPRVREEIPMDGIGYIMVDAEDIANMQRCVRDYEEMYPNPKNWTSALLRKCQDG